MASRSSIEWTECTWNPLTGCTKVSPGCHHCYAERMSKRLKAMGQPNYQAGFRLALHPQVVKLPLEWPKPQTVFVNSMSDLFHEGVRESFIQSVFGTMRQAAWHRFQVLTKRSRRLVELDPRLDWASNIWMGVSVESDDYVFRADHLRATAAQVKFLSLEPLLGPLPSLELAGIDWVIVGGESGPGARPMDLGWVRDIRDHCLRAGVPFFLKQLGGYPGKRGGDEAVLDGTTWAQMPSRTDVPC
jgi:protein gp37